MKRYLTLTVLFTPSHFGAGESSRTHDANTSNPQLHGAQNSLSHRPLVSNSLLDLLRYRLRYKLCVNIRMAYLNNVDMNLFFGAVLKRRLQIIDALALAPDDHSRLCGMQ